ncbi:hypothetical protein ACQCVH_22145 [Bacillus infantis]|uniref:hypothetical protein n=1 Tax=Bacillus infantis TaxID=324767 RepID=UPI003CE7A078
MNLPILIHDKCPSCKPKDYNQTKARFMGQENFGEYLYQCVECAADLWVTEAWAKKHAIEENKDLDTIENLVFDLYLELGSTGIHFLNLRDIEILAGRILEGMEGSADQGKEKLYFEEHLRSVRMLWKLIRGAMGDWKLQIHELEKISTDLTNQVEAQKEKEKSI